jgi:phage terminase large subunit GpA-like protein
MLKHENVFIPLTDEDFLEGTGWFDSEDLAALACGEISEGEPTMADARKVYREAFCAGLRPDPVLTVSAWADAHRILPQKAAAEHGKWRTSRTPYLREIMDRLSPSDPAQVVVFMKGAQIGGTEAGNNAIGFWIDRAPGPIMMVQPTVEMAKRVSKQRIAPMIADCPRLADKVHDTRSRDSGNTIQAKEFPGGILVMTGANSAVGLRSMPVRYLFMDEVDGYESDIDGEGSPVDLAIKRTSTFRRNRKIFINSTPKVKDISNIERAYNSSDRRRYYIPCPYCGVMAPIEWRNIRWPKGKPEEAALLCGSCEQLIGEHHKTEMLEHGRWIPEAEGDGVTVGYHLSALYSPVGWYSWAEAAKDKIAAKHGGMEKEKTWVNTVLGEVSQEPGETIDPTGLLARREHYNAEVPERVLVLTAGVDTQDDRLEVEIVGWRTGEESWGIDYRVLWGDPDGSHVWKQLDDLLASPWVREDGARLRVISCCIDSGGHRTEAVYRYVKTRQARGIFATVGRAGAGRPIVSAPMRKKQGKQKQPVKLFTVGTDEAKDLLLARLHGTEHGPGYCHFPQRDSHGEQYFLQLTAEKRFLRHVKGVPRYEWRQIRDRNEALDCRILAHAALCLLNPRWPAIERRLAPVPPEQETEDGQDEPTEMPAPRKGPTRRPRSNWMNRWRG